MPFAQEDRARVEMALGRALVAALPPAWDRACLTLTAEVVEHQLQVEHDVSGPEGATEVFTLTDELARAMDLLVFAYGNANAMFRSARYEVRQEDGSWKLDVNLDYGG